MYLAGKNMTTIAGELGIGLTTVHHDISCAREEWRTRAADAIDELKKRELSRIDQLETEAWKGWLRSIGKTKIIRTESGTGSQGPINKTSETVEKKAGDPRFLEQVNRCIESRRKILGLDAPNKIGFGADGSAELVGEIRVVNVK
jgi:hypothetical protein